MDQVTPNLPSRDFESTSSFYSRLGFIEGWRDDGWKVLTRDSLTLEFFPHPELNPADSWSGFYALCTEAELPKQCWGHPRVQPPQEEDSGLTIAALIDPDGTLLRLIQN